MLRSGMPREHVKELRGDARKEAIDPYLRFLSEMEEANDLAISNLYFLPIRKNLC